MTASRKALIVGAGIGGLAAGVSLRRAGWDVRIYERAANPRELGFALALAPNAIAALDELGLAEHVRSAGVTGSRFEMRHADGRVLRTFSSQPGGRLVMALRPALHGALLQAVGIDALVLDSEVVEVDGDVDHGEVKLKDGRSDAGDVLVGADGVGSLVRRHLHPGEPGPRSSGYYAVRGVVRDVGDQLGPFSGIGYLGDGIEAAAIRASQDAVYWYLSLLAADVERLASHDVQNVVSTLTAGFDPPFRAIIAATAPEDMRLDRLFVRSPLPHWGAGRITLLGDAAHPVLPHTGQGAAQALEDAVALGLVLRREGDVTRGLREYERVRSHRTRRLMAMGPRIAKMTTTRNPVRIWARTALVKMVPEFLVTAASAHKDPHRALRAE